jgi:hypothetical protein
MCRNKDVFGGKSYQLCEAPTYSLTSLAQTAFPLSNEAEVKEDQEEYGMDNGADAADLRRLDKARAQERHGYPRQVEIKKNPRVHEEGACKELADVLPRNPPEDARHSAFPSC